MELMSIRRQSWKAVAELGLEVNEALPLLDCPAVARSIDQIFRRLLCLHTLAAVAFGFDKQKALAWVNSEGIFSDFTDDENVVLQSGKKVPSQFKFQIEGMWALAWALGLIPAIDFLKPCDQTFAALLPDLISAESSLNLRAKISLRPIEQQYEMCDLAYCLHWAVRERELKGFGVPFDLASYVIPERRRALEWLICDEPWNEIALDT
jgi:hypothetical protein